MFCSGQKRSVDFRGGGEMKKIILLLFLLILPITVYADRDGLFDIHYRDTNITEVKNKIKNGADVNAVDEFGRTPLFWAIDYYNENALGIVRYLISQGADVNYVSNDGYTPLMRAVSKNKIGIVSVLLENGADIYHKNIFYENAIQIAYKKDYRDIYNLLRKSIKYDTAHSGKCDNNLLGLFETNNIITIYENEALRDSHSNEKDVTVDFTLLHELIHLFFFNYELFAYRGSRFHQTQMDLIYEYTNENENLSGKSHELLVEVTQKWLSEDNPLELPIMDGYKYRMRNGSLDSNTAIKIKDNIRQVLSNMFSTDELSDSDIYEKTKKVFASLESMDDHESNTKLFVAYIKKQSKHLGVSEDDLFNEISLKIKKESCASEEIISEVKKGL